MAWYFNPFTANFDYYVIGATGSVVDNLLLETGDQILLEDASAIQLEG